MKRKWLLISLFTVIALVIVVIVIVRDALTNIDLTVESEGVDANIHSLQDIQTLLSGQGAITLKFLVGMKNGNWFKIPIRDLETRVYYRGQLIGNSSPSSLKNIDIGSGSYKQWIEPVDLHAKGSLVKQLLTEVLQGGDPVIMYETELKVWGVRYTYSDQIQLIETALS